MHGHRDTSKRPRIFTTAAHLIAVMLAAWWLLSSSADGTRGVALIACGFIYFARATFGMFVLLKRKFAWTEAGIVTGLFVTLHASFAYLGARSTAAPGRLDIAAVALYLIGSYLNTASEYGRHRWKRDRANSGKLYTGGLFRYAMHINYFGDTLLFTGFALLTGSLWALLVPLIMTLGFVFQHVPTLDRYLAERYGRAFDAYAKETKKLIPYLY